MSFSVLPPEINSLRMFSGAGSGPMVAVAATRAAGVAGQAGAVVGVFEAARAAMVHPLAVAANRDVFVRLVLSNVFGQNAPAIAAAEGMYEEFWAADVAAMVGYHGGASATVAQMASWPAALQGANLDLGNLGSLNLGSPDAGHTVGQVSNHAHVALTYQIHEPAIG